MHRVAGRTIDRRLTLGGGLAAAAGLALPRTQIRGRVITQRGIAGGGLVRFAAGEAQFSLAASSLTITDDGREGEPAALGSVVWVDASVGVVFVSQRVTVYESLHLIQGQGRRIEGVFDAGESGAQPFVMEAVDFAGPGAGADRISLRVGAAIGARGATPGSSAGFTYIADGEVVVGDVQTRDFEIDVESGEVRDLTAA